ncbi:MAG: inositol monophosphatase family protein [Burkholderiales bacterium]|nr:inositol monophosphatase family protein [Burkholderiales bacterium]GIK86926.1 MAG: histidinol-phosphatase [Betaproteobacteria bacterium]
MDLPAALEFALLTSQAAGRAILPHFRASLDVENKDVAGGYDPVTIADRAAETVIRDAIRARFPAHGLHGEEHGREAGSVPWHWVIDPIDGTKSFVLGQLHWGVLIALNDGERPVVGVAYQPFVGEAFVAHADGPAEWRRGDERRPLRTRRCPRLADAIAVTTDPRFFAAPHAAAAFEAVTGPLRFTRYGGDLYCYTQLAMGLSDVVIETGLKPYDIQALVPLIERAGGVVSDWQGRPCYDGGDVLACGDPALHEALLRRIADAR